TPEPRRLERRGRVDEAPSKPRNEECGNTLADCHMNEHGRLVHGLRQVVAELSDQPPGDHEQACEPVDQLRHRAVMEFGISQIHYAKTPRFGCGPIDETRRLSN